MFLYGTNSKVVMLNLLSEALCLSCAATEHTLFYVHIVFTGIA